MVAAGGDMGYGYSWMKEGRDVVRIFHPSTMKWETLPDVQLSEYRWYPTQVSATRHVGFFWHLLFAGLAACLVM